MTVFPPCEKCGEKISRRPTDKLCGKCYLQKRKDARDKITKKTGNITSKIFKYISTNYKFLLS